MKYVFSNDELFHVWANKGQSEGRNTNGSLRFEGDDLYSYRMLLSTRVNGKLFMRDNGTSNTTNRHLSMARRAVHEVAYPVPNLEGHLKQPPHRTLYSGAFYCADAIKNLLLKLGSMQSLAKQQATLDKARGYEASGLLLLNGGKWPLKRLPSCVTTLEGMKELSKEYARAEHLGLYKSQLKAAEAGLARLENVIKPGISCRSSYVKSLNSLFETHLREADKHHRLVHGKVSTACIKLRSKCFDLMSAAAPRLAALERAEIEDEIAEEVLRLKLQLESTYYLKNCRTQLQFLLEKLPDSKHKVEAEEALAAWKAGLLQDMKDGFDNGLFILRGSEDTLEGRLHKCRALKDLAGQIAAEGGEVDATILAEIVAMEGPIREAIEAADRASLADWLAGGKGRRPSPSVGTFARIVGDKVETNLGAVVPLQHAQRLAKIAQRVIKSGGKTWLPGTGPKVGYYEVKSIAADGTTVIGCHGFDAEVANAMITKLLENVNEETFNLADSAFIGTC